MLRCCWSDIAQFYQIVTILPHSSKYINRTFVSFYFENDKPPQNGYNTLSYTTAYGDRPPLQPKPTFSPIELAAISDCTLKFQFLGQAGQLRAWQTDPLTTTVRQTINELHANGGPYRLNLPATLRKLGQFVPPDLQTDVEFNTVVRQMIIAYHRRLKDDWAKVIASHEEMQLSLRLQRSFIQVEGIVDRVDKEADGGITAVKLIPSLAPLPESLADEGEANIEATLLHALVAATYPHRRPVRVKLLWLYHNQAHVIELTEKQYRHNLGRMQGQLQAWLEGRIMARPGSYCSTCPFRTQGCPIYPADFVSFVDDDEPENAAAAVDLFPGLDLAHSSPSATFSAHQYEDDWEEDDYVESETDP